MKDSIRFNSGARHIEVNDAGEYVTIHLGDVSFFEGFAELQKWLSAETKKQAIREANRKTDVFEATIEELSEFSKLSREMNEKIDALFGEGALRKAFPDTKKPTLDKAMEFVEGMLPFVNEAMAARQESLSSKYNANRKGAHSK